jgi:Fic family protein
VTNVPFDSLPKLPPAVDFAVPEIFAAVIAASNALARLDEIAELLDNSAVFMNAIPALEAQASSQIEQIVTTNDAIFRAEVSGTKPDIATDLALRLRRSITLGAELASKRGLTSKLAETICSELLGHEMKPRANAGTVIQSNGQTIYTPPSPVELPRLLAEWEGFMNSSDSLHPLIVMALGHYQFEAIHPFSDGNGRTGRVLNVLALVNAGLLKEPVLQMSRAIEVRRNDYYRLLNRVTAEGAWVEWVLFMLEVVAEAARDSAHKLKAITMLQLTFGERYETKAELVPLLFEKPYCQIGHVVERCGVTRVTAANWLESLENQGALGSVVSGREKFFVNRELLEVLND